jgi:hypothetical protein
MSKWTLAAMKSLNLSLEAYCQTKNCNQFVVFDIDKLISVKGSAFVMPEIVPNMKCEKCGGKLKTALAMLHLPEQDKDRRLN